MKTSYHQPPVSKSSGEVQDRSPSSCPLLVFVLAVSCNLALSTPSTQQTMLRDEFKKALLARSAKWTDGVVDEWASMIADFAVRRNGGDLSDKQVRDIAAGLRSQLGDVPVVTDLTHPVLREYCKQALLYKVANYLELGTGNPQPRAQLLQQAQGLLEAWSKDLTGRYPALSESIIQARQGVLAKITAAADHPFAQRYKQPVDTATLQKAHLLWAKQLDSFNDLTLPPSQRRQVLQIETLFFRSLAGLRNMSKGPTVPQPPALKAARLNVKEYDHEIAKFNLRMHEIKRKEKEARVELEYQLQRIGDKETIHELARPSLDEIPDSLAVTLKDKSKTALPPNPLPTSSPEPPGLTYAEPKVDGPSTVIASWPPKGLWFLLASCFALLTAALVIGWRLLSSKRKQHSQIQEPTEVARSYDQDC